MTRIRLILYPAVIVGAEPAGHRDADTARHPDVSVGQCLPAGPLSEHPRIFDGFPDSYKQCQTCRAQNAEKANRNPCPYEQPGKHRPARHKHSTAQQKARTLTVTGAFGSRIFVSGPPLCLHLRKVLVVSTVHAVIVDTGQPVLTLRCRSGGHGTVNSTSVTPSAWYPTGTITACRRSKRRTSLPGRNQPPRPRVTARRQIVQPPRQWLGCGPLTQQQPHAHALPAKSYGEGAGTEHDPPAVSALYPAQRRQ